MTMRTHVVLRRLHLWLGMVLGGLFALLGLTGSALVFYIEIDAALNPPPRVEAVTKAPGWESPVWDRALATARARWPDPKGEWSFEAADEGGLIPARYYPPSRHHDHHAEREMVWFSADGSRIVRSDTWGQYLMSWIYELHMHLLAGEIGSQVVGWSGFAVLGLLVTGVATWWPRGRWRKALAFKRDAAPLRRLRDLHKHAGLWSAVLLFLLALTGVLLALPNIRQQIFAATIAMPDRLPSPKSTRSSGDQVPIARALAAGHAALPDARLAFIDVPGTGNAPFKLRVQIPGDPHRRFPSSFIFVDQYSGGVLAVHDIRRGNASTWTAKWIRALHDGSVGGLATRILTMVIGLAPAALFVTGLLHWSRRRSARQSNHSKATQQRGHS